MTPNIQFHKLATIQSGSTDLMLPTVRVVPFMKYNLEALMSYRSHGIAVCLCSFSGAICSSFPLRCVITS